MAARKKGKGKRPSVKAPPVGAMANVVDVGQQIWLAGLGALARAQHEGPKLFESLVKEGGALQARQQVQAQHLAKAAWEGLRTTVDERTAGIRGKATETLDNLETIFQSRVHKALQQLGMPTSQEINALSRKVNELNRSVHALTRKPATKGTTPRKATPPVNGEGAAV